MQWCAPAVAAVAEAGKLSGQKSETSLGGGGVRDSYNI